MVLKVDIEKKIGNFRLRSCFETDSERFALLGASGCGKTMTLKCIAGIEKPDRGTITLGDQVLFDSEKKINIPARKRGVGYLFQDYALFPNMTVRGNICCAAVSGEYAEEMIERFCLSDVAEQYPATLSGGQKQRTALARMLSTGPKVILLDEPFSALDNYMRTRMELEIIDLLEHFDGPSILVTHDRNEAYRLSDRIGVMEQGNIVEIKQRKDFFDHPDTVAAARLTGCKNISRLVKEEGRWNAVDWGITLHIPEEGSDAGYVGYRAHYFSFVPAGTTEPGKESGQKEKTDMPVNQFDCELQRVIEDTFSVVICFRQAGNTVDTADSLLTWIVNYAEWESVKEEVLSGRFTLRLNESSFMLLN